MSGFVFQTTRNLLCELGSAKKVGSLITNAIKGRIGGGKATKNVIIVTDGGISKAQLHATCLQGIQAEGFNVILYDKVVADPPEKFIEEAVHLAKSNEVCAVVGFGGGSSMDVAKLVAFLGHDGCAQSLQQLYGVGMCVGERLPLLQVPTTAGTGSEVTPISIVTTGAASKKGIVSPVLLPDWAVLDGELTASVPPHVAAATGIDAMVHAIEAYTCATKKNPLSDVLAREALRLLGGSIREVCQRHLPLASDSAAAAAASVASARSCMLLGSMYAGMAFANAPVAAVHALAYPIGSLHHVPHGLSNALMLPHVIRYNAAVPDTARQYQELSGIVFGNTNTNTSTSTSSAGGAAGLGAPSLFADQFEALAADLKVPRTLREVGIAAGDVDALATEAMSQTRLLPNNPRPVGLEDARALYNAAL